MNLKERLYEWRDTEAHSRAIELWRVLTNRSLDEIADKEPKSLRELALISGMGPTKLALYGNVLIGIVSGAPVEDKAPARPASVKVNEEVKVKKTTVKEKESISVGFFIEHVNRSMRQLPARIRGEVTQYKFQGNAYFTIKDKDEDAVLDVMMWASDFNLSGVALSPGMEVVVEGFAEVYKPWGRFSFKAKTVEYAGEGALKKQYEELKKKLTIEGLLNGDRKRPLSPYPHHIGVITSRSGAVIEDFLNNLGRYGFKVSLIDTRVEGAAAAPGVLASIETMRHLEIDTLVVIRGGGSFESLQAFNNEQVVRTLREFSESVAPVVCAIGHHQDEPLAQLVADFAPSTPTACAELLNDPWDRVLAEIGLHEQRISSSYRQVLDRSHRDLDRSRYFLEEKFGEFERVINVAAQGVRSHVSIIAAQIVRSEKILSDSRSKMIHAMDLSIVRMNDLFRRFDATLSAHDPMRQLRLGYSVARKGEGLVRRVKDVNIGDVIELQISDGALGARIEQIYDSEKVSE